MLPCYLIFYIVYARAGACMFLFYMYFSKDPFVHPNGGNKGFGNKPATVKLEVSLWVKLRLCAVSSDF